jgi:hypothetical protein
MCDTDTETASQALHELARWVIRDRVDNDHLEDYMRGLLSKRLIELHASCRYEAIVVARHFRCLGAREVACHLHKRARELERTSSVFPAYTPWDLRQKAVSSISLHPKVSPIRTRQAEVPVRRDLLSWIPEMIASIVCIGVGVSLLYVECDDSILHLTAIIGYVILGFIFAIAALHAAWRNAHPSGRR